LQKEGGILHKVRHWKASLALISLFIAVPAVPVLQSQASKSGIHGVDFKNLSYPWEWPNHWPDHLQWMSLGLKNHVQLVNGKWDGRDEQDKADDRPFEGLTLEGVDFVHLSNQPDENAIVVLRYDTGGTQNHYWVYIYGFSAGAPKLMAFFHAGDRAYHGLATVTGNKGKLIVDLYDPDREEGDCCSSGLVRYVFRWNGNGFEPVGKPSKRNTDRSSRRPVSIFGLPVDRK
jgi:hypothetical protein